MQAFTLERLVLVVDWHNRVLQIDLGHSVKCIVDLDHLILSELLLEGLTEELPKVALDLLEELREVEDALLAELHDCMVGEMRHVYQDRLVQPAALDDHLHQMDQVHGCPQETLVGCYVYHTL